MLQKAPRTRRGPPAPTWRWARDALLGTERKLGAHLISIVVSIGAYTASVLSMWCSVGLGLTSAVLPALHTPFLLLGPWSFYIAVRSGWSQRVAYRRRRPGR